MKTNNIMGDNSASGSNIIRTVIEKVKTYIGKGDPKFGKIAYRAVYESCADTSKAERLLGWRSNNH